MPCTFYKLVRPDYNSFYDNGFAWPKSGPVKVAHPAPASDPCGAGLHLARTVAAGLRYAKFPFRILEVRPLSPVLGEDETKIRVAKAEVLRELPVPDWVKKMEARLIELPQEMKAIPWFKGTDAKKATSLIKTHLKLLTPFGLKIDFKVKVVTTSQEAQDAAAARDAAWDAARDAAWDAAMDAAWAAARDAAMDAARAAAWDAAWAAARAAARDAARAAARDAAWDAAMDAAWDAAMDAAMDAARDAAADRMPQENPFKPLWECWKLGAWPIGFVGENFVVFVPGKKK